MKHQMIFVNLPVADIQASREFFTRLGYSFNEEFCDDQRCLSLTLGDSIHAMLLHRDFFDSFHDGKSRRGEREVLLCLSAESREQVDELADKAVHAGGRLVRTEDQGPLYGRSFSDLDGHIWEVMWMDLAATA